MAELNTLAQKIVQDMCRDTPGESVKESVTSILSVAPQLIDQHDYFSKSVYDLERDQFGQLQVFLGVSDTVQQKTEGLALVIAQIAANEDYQEHEERLVKFDRNLKLACHQRQFLEAVSQDAHKVAKEAKLSSEEALKIKNKIYSEFIAILGIFTAISFMSMGSLQILGNVFQEVDNIGDASLGYAILLSGIYLFVLYMLVMVMFVGMKKMIHANRPYQFDRGFSFLLSLAVVILMIVGLSLIGKWLVAVVIVIAYMVGLFGIRCLTRRGLSLEEGIFGKNNRKNG